MGAAGALGRIVLYGSVEQEPESLVLTAGAHSAEFVVGNPRDIRVDGVEVIRAINGGRTVWLANLTARSPTVRLKGARGPGALSLRSLDAASWKGATIGENPDAQTLAGETLTLAPFAIAQIDEAT